MHAMKVWVQTYAGVCLACLAVAALLTLTPVSPAAAIIVWGLATIGFALVFVLWAATALVFRFAAVRENGRALSGEKSS
jgi:hypothetical protein